jgi:polyisoprenoid-binding protein YceI
MSTWVIDPDHSVAAFIVRHMMVANVRGQFNRVSGTIRFDPSDISRSSVEAVIDVSGISTGILKRDEHLRSPDFFDIARHPEIVFKSTKANPISGARFRVTGDLTIHGITHPITFDAEYFGPVKGTEGETTIGLAATARINREDYRMIWNVPLPGGGIMVGKEIQIMLDIEADLSD